VSLKPLGARTRLLLCGHPPSSWSPPALWLPSGAAAAEPALALPSGAAAAAPALAI